MQRHLDMARKQAADTTQENTFDCVDEEHGTIDTSQMHVESLDGLRANGDSTKELISQQNYPSQQKASSRTDTTASPDSREYQIQPREETMSVDNRNVGSVNSNDQRNDSDFDEVMSKLLISCEKEFQMHRLAAAFFDKRHFWIMFLPATLLTSAASVICFSADGDHHPPPPSFPDLWLVLGGCISVISTLIQTLSNQLKMGSRGEMHRAAVVDLDKLKDNIRFRTQVRAAGDSETVLRATDQSSSVETYQEVLAQIKQSCKSIVPIEITQAFTSIESHVYHAVEENGIRRQRLMEMAFAEVYLSISNSRLWPLIIPRASHTIDKVLEHLYAEHDFPISRPASDSKRQEQST